MALEWLKTILGDAYNDDIDKKVSEEVGKNFVSRSDFNTLNETKKTLDGQIKDRDGQLEELKKVDASGLQAEITRLQSENTKAQTEYDRLSLTLPSKLSSERQRLLTLKRSAPC